MDIFYLIIYFCKDIDFSYLIFVRKIIYVGPTLMDLDLNWRSNKLGHAERRPTLAVYSSKDIILSTCIVTFLEMRKL